MSYLPVDFCVLAVTTDKPISGALVKVFAQDGKSVYGEMLSGDDGKASFLLFGPQRYQARAYKFSTGFTNPIYFDVDPAPNAKNSFIIRATPVDYPTSNDPRLCMCAGYFRKPDGSAAAGLDIHIITKFHPILLDGSGVLTERVSVRTDSSGWVQVPLIRFGQYDVLLEGYEDVTREICVPAAPACNLPDLVFEVVSQVDISPQPIVVRRGQILDVYPEVYTSIGRKLDGTARDKVCWKVADTNIAGVTVSWDRLVFYGHMRGTTSLSATRADQTIVRIPDPPLLPGIPILVV